MLTYSNAGRIAKIEQKLKELDELAKRVESLETELAEAKREIEMLKCK